MFQPSPLRGLPAKTPRLFSSRDDHDRLVNLPGPRSLGLGKAAGGEPGPLPARQTFESNACFAAQAQATLSVPPAAAYSMAS